MKQQAAWNKLAEQMSGKRARNDASGKKKNVSSAPHELTVQRLALEPDNKQTYQTSPATGVLLIFHKFLTGRIRYILSDLLSKRIRLNKILISLAAKIGETF
jgi:hypothetical protein